jgi:hypothetical protein
MNIIWSDFSHESENSQKMIRAKQINGTEYWSTMREVFAHDTATLPLNRFRLWASMHNVPFITQYRTSKFLGEAFRAASVDDEIAEALTENWIGIPDPTPLLVASDFSTSMQRIQDIAHLVITDFAKKVKDMESIVEIGAGYGDMCSVIHALGFKGKYTIVDIPEMRPVQEFYLGKQGITPSFSFEDSNVGPADLVIGTWSLSETSREYRDQFLPKIKDSKNWLILSQAKVFGEEFNHEYFRDFFMGKNLTEIPLVSSGLANWDGDNIYYVVTGRDVLNAIDTFRIHTNL